MIVPSASVDDAPWPGHRYFARGKVSARVGLPPSDRADYGVGQFPIQAFGSSERLQCTDDMGLGGIIAAHGPAPGWLSSPILIRVISGPVPSMARRPLSSIPHVRTPGEHAYRAPGVRQKPAVTVLGRRS